MENKQRVDVIYVDLDGVTFDFNKKAIEIAGFTPDHAAGDKEKRREFWRKLENHVKNGGKFFEELEPLPDARQLWDFLNTLPVPKIVNTATGHLPGAEAEKRAAVKKFLGAEHAQKAIIVRDGKDKAKHATPTAVLIDDRMKVIGPWVEAGGIGILHTSAASTIKQLKELFDGV